MQDITAFLRYVLENHLVKLIFLKGDSFIPYIHIILTLLNHFMLSVVILAIKIRIDVKHI